MTLKIAHRGVMRVLWCDAVFSGTLEWSFVFQDIQWESSNGLEVSHVGLGIHVGEFLLLH